MKLNEKNFNRESLMHILAHTKDVTIVGTDNSHILVKAESALPFQELFTLGETTAWCFSKIFESETKSSGKDYFYQYVQQYNGHNQYILFDLTKPFGSVKHILSSVCPFRIKDGYTLSNSDIRLCDSVIAFTTKAYDKWYGHSVTREEYGYFNTNELFWWCYDICNNNLLASANKDRFERMKSILSDLRYCK